MSFSLRTMVEGTVSGVQGLFTAAGTTWNQAGAALEEKKREAKFHRDRFSRSADATVKQLKENSAKTWDVVYNYDLTTPAKATAEGTVWLLDESGKKIEQTQEELATTIGDAQEGAVQNLEATGQVVDATQRNWRRGLADFIRPKD